MARIILLTPSRRFIANRYGLGYQIPLGLVNIGGPLLDAGHTVRLIDNDVHGWKPDKLNREIGDFAPDYVMLGHTGSTAAHHVCLQTAWEIKNAFPEVCLVYGGVFPSYAAEHILENYPWIDVIVRGEGEETVVELVNAKELGEDWKAVKGISWRWGNEVVRNPARPAIQNLDDYRPGYELVEWEHYNLFGFGRAAGIQFARGCPLTCTFCGQWMFWKKWRHFSPAVLVEHLRVLRDKYQVNIIWFADENFTANRQVLEEVLDLLIQADLGLSLNINATAADIVRDADIMHLYKQAGIDWVVLGVESVEDAELEAVRKDSNPYAISCQAMQILRKHAVLSFANMIFGLDDETMGSIFRKMRKIIKMDPDVMNAEYITPHFWTSDGKATDPADIIQPDTRYWTYRNQILRSGRLRPWQLTLAVKLAELAFGLRPKWFARMLFAKDFRYRKLLRRSFRAGVGVWLGEFFEFLFHTKFVKPGTLSAIPDAPPRKEKSNRKTEENAKVSA